MNGSPNVQLGYGSGTGGEAFGMAAGRVSGGSSIQEAMKRSAPVPEALAVLEKSVHAVFAELDGLESRLGSVLLPAPSGNQVGGGKNATLSPSVSNQINSASSALQDAARRLADLRERLEL